MMSTKLQKRLAMLDGMAHDVKVSETLANHWWHCYMMATSREDREFYGKQYASRAALHEVQVRSYDLMSKAFFGY